MALPYIANIRKISAVIIDGKVYSKALLDEKMKALKDKFASALNKPK